MKNTMEQKVVKISDLIKTTRGFHKTTILSCNANALLRSQKTDTIVSLAHNIQRGDYIVFDVVPYSAHPIISSVWEVTFVSNIPNSTQTEGFGQAALSLKRIVNATYHRGGIDDKYIYECIVFDENSKD